MPRYKVTYRNGHFRYFAADSADEARQLAIADRKQQDAYNRSVGASPMSPVKSVKKDDRPASGSDW